MRGRWKKCFCAGFCKSVFRKNVVVPAPFFCKFVFQENMFYLSVSGKNLLFLHRFASSFFENMLLCLRLFVQTRFSQKYCCTCAGFGKTSIVFAPVFANPFFKKMSLCLRRFLHFFLLILLYMRGFWKKCFCAGFCKSGFSKKCCCACAVFLQIRFSGKYVLLKRVRKKSVVSAPVCKFVFREHVVVPAPFCAKSFFTKILLYLRGFWKNNYCFCTSFCKSVFQEHVVVPAPFFAN